MTWSSCLAVAPVIILEGDLEAELHRIIRLRAPQEAVGLILEDRKVVELINHSSAPEAHFEIHRADVIAALAEETQLENVILWHSHPSGGVGPSRIDLQQRTAFPSHLVLTLIADGIIPSWY